MGLIHATSLERWQEWRRVRHPGRRLARALGSLRGAGDRASDDGLRLHSREGEGPGRVLIVVDPDGPASCGDLLAPLPYLHGAVDVLTVAGADHPALEAAGWDRTDVDAPGRTLHGRGLTAVLSAGQHGEVAAMAHRWARQVQVPSYVLQSGSLTPYTAPLPPETTVLAWSRADGEFWRSGREDLVVRAIGSQRLWQAHHEGRPERAGPREDADPADDDRPDDRPDERVVFLGHLSDEALSRRLSVRAATTFCRRHGGRYRPGPDDTDPGSRLAHQLLRRRGVEFVAPDGMRTAPVAAVRSVEVLEAASRGIPAWVHAPDPPTWLREYWERYGMRRYGGPEATPAPALPEAEPAAALAEILESDG